MIHFAKVTGRRARKVEGGVFFVSIVASSSSSSSWSACVLKVCPRACWTTTITALHALLILLLTLISSVAAAWFPPRWKQKLARLTDDTDTLTMHRVCRQPARQVFRLTVTELTSRHAELPSAGDSRRCSRRRILIDKSSNWSSRAHFFFLLQHTQT